MDVGTARHGLGAGGWLAYAAGRVAARVPGLGFHRYRLMAVPRSGMPEMPRGYTTAELGRNEGARLWRDLALAERIYDYRVGQGMICLGALRGERLIGCTFVTTEPFEEDEVAVRFVPPPGAAWDTGLYIRPEDRASRAFSVLWAATGEWLAGQGLDWCMSRIAHYNLPALRAHDRMSAVDIGGLTALRVGGATWRFGAPREIRLRLP